MGGTHVDAVLIHKGKIVEATKSPTDRTNLFKSVWEPLKSIISTKDSDKIKRIILSTTVSTNAIVEQKTDSVGMIIECGPGLSGDFLCCGNENVFISGYMDHRGREVSPINTQEINQVANTFKQQGISAVAVTGKFSVRNSEHEMKIYDMLKDEFSPITLEYTIRKLNFPRVYFLL